MRKIKKLKHWVNKMMRLLLLMLFLGYYGSITLFTHTHIANGVTIVHSHPFNHGTDKTPIKHEHTANGFLLIQCLSNFLTTIFVVAYSTLVFSTLLKNRILQKKEDHLSNCILVSSNGLRAPPLSIYN